MCGSSLVTAAAAKSLQSCPTLCDPIDSSQPGSPVPGILQARTLGWVAISFSIVWKWKVKVKSLSYVRLVATWWTAAHQAPPSMGFFQARVLEWGAIAFSIAWKWKVKVKSLSHVRLVVTWWTAAYQAPWEPCDFPCKSTGVGSLDLANYGYVIPCLCVLGEGRELLPNNGI